MILHKTKKIRETVKPRCLILEGLVFFFISRQFLLKNFKTRNINFLCLFFMIIAMNLKLYSGTYKTVE